MRTILGLLLLGSLSVEAQVKPDITAGDATVYQAKARKIYERLAGIKAPLDSAVINSMTTKIQQGDLAGAADIAIQDPNFLNVTIKNMALRLSTRDESIRTPFNDFSATWIGVVRDDLDARQLLTGNFYYMADPAKLAAAGKTLPSTGSLSTSEDLRLNVVESNKHFADMENLGLDYQAILQKVDGQQISVGGKLQANPDPAGLITSRTFMTAHALAGTNRRPVEYTFREFMCVTMPEWSDTGAPDLRIGPDVTRFPAGNNNLFETSCKGCHTQMDSFRGAFAYWDAQSSDANALYTAGKAASKYARNSGVFPEGYLVKDNSFINNSNRATNAATFGWRGSNVSYGNGVKDFAAMVSGSTRFSQCMTKRAFETACKSDFKLNTNLGTIQKYATQFEANGYNFKKLFRSVATSPECLGE